MPVNWPTPAVLSPDLSKLRMACLTMCRQRYDSALALRTKVVIVNELKYEVCATVVTDDLRADLILIRLRL
jgi:hypothetical protein